MPRLMSVSMTEQAVRDRTKTVTRRKGWMFLKPGDRVTLCRKVMGRKPGEPLERIAEVEIVSVRREPLRDVAAAGELTAEGFPEWELDDFGSLAFIERYFRPQGIGPCDDVTRVEWRYLDAAPGPFGDKETQQ